MTAIHRTTGIGPFAARRLSGCGRPLQSRLGRVWVRARKRCRRRLSHPHRQRYAHDWADGTVNSGDQLWLGIALAKTAAGQSRNERQSSGKLRHLLRQRSENVALPVGARTPPFGDLSQRASATGAIARTRIERADFDARRFQTLSRCSVQTIAPSGNLRDTT